MNFRDELSKEIHQELANTRKILERVPEDKFDWRPHAKSTNLLKLATHVATLSRFATIIFETDSLDMSKFTPPPEAFSRKELLETFDKLAGAAEDAITKASDDAFAASWSLTAGATPIFTMTKYAVLRRLFMNHLIHHRSQLIIYLRMNDVPIPGMYGPSADER